MALNIVGNFISSLFWTQKKEEVPEDEKEEVSKEESDSLFFPHDLPQLLKSCPEFIPLDVAKLIAEYVINDHIFFGAKEWREYLGVDVGPVPKPPETTSQFFSRRDSFNPKQFIYQSHFGLILIPSKVRIIKTGVYYPFCLALFAKLILHPLKGNPANLRYDADRLPKSLVLSDPETAKKNKPFWYSMRQEVVYRNLSFAKQKSSIANLNIKTGVGYDESPSALFVIVAPLLFHLVTGQRWLGNDTGMEKQRTWSYCQEHIENTELNFQTTVGSFCSEKEHFIPYSDAFLPELSVTFKSPIRKDPSTGIAMVKKFD